MAQPARYSSWLTYTLLGVAVLLPLGSLIALPNIPPAGPPPELKAAPASQFPASSLPLSFTQLGPGPGYRPLITNLQIVDLDGHALPDVIACDSRGRRVLWYR